MIFASAVDCSKTSSCGWPCCNCDSDCDCDWGNCENGRFEKGPGIWSRAVVAVRIPVADDRNGLARYIFMVLFVLSLLRLAPII